MTATIHQLPRSEARGAESTPPRPDCIANDDHGELPAGVALAEAYGGRIGLAVMVLVAALIGAMLAIGGVL